MFKIIEVGTGYSSIPAKVGAATEIVVEDLTKSFMKKGYDVTVVDLEDKNRPKTEIRFMEIRMPEFLKKTAYNLGIMHRVKRVIYSLQIAPLLNKLDMNKKYIFHFHNQYNYFFFEKMVKKSVRKNIHTVYTLHSYIWSQPWKEIEQLVKKKYFLEVYSFKHADTLLVLNDSAKRNIVNHLGIPESKIVLMPNGVNNKVYAPIKDNKPINDLKKKHKIGSEKVLFHVGSVCPRKNQLGIIKEIKDIMKKHNIKFLYAGGIIDSEYSQQIQDYVKNEGIEKNVIYLGEVKPGKCLNEYYNLADAFIFHSTSEAFGLVPLEALSAGNPVFMSENLKNYFYPKSSTDGFIYFNEKNAKKIIEKYFFNDKLMEKYSKEALAYIKANFSWDAVAEKHLTLFKRIMNE